MGAKLFVRGLKDPIELESEEATVAQDLIADTKKDPKTPFKIEGVWSGTKAEMKYVIFDQKEKSRYTPDAIVMSNDKAKRLEAELKPFEDIAVEQGFKPHDSFAFWLQSKGAIRLDMHNVAHKPEMKRYAEVITDLAKYTILSNELTSYTLWLGRKQYSEKKRIEGLQELADQMSV